MIVNIVYTVLTMSLGLISDANRGHILPLELQPYANVALLTTLTTSCIVIPLVDRMYYMSMYNFVLSDKSLSCHHNRIRIMGEISFHRPLLLAPR